MAHLMQRLNSLCDLIPTKHFRDGTLNLEVD